MVSYLILLGTNFPDYWEEFLAYNHIQEFTEKREQCRVLRLLVHNCVTDTIVITVDDHAPSSPGIPPLLGRHDHDPELLDMDRDLGV